MHIVGLVVSVDYADYLSVTIPEMVKVVDKLYVMTAENDRSREIAEKYGAIPILWKDWKIDGAHFNKSGAINYAQSVVYDKHPESWYLILDADILLPDNTREIIEKHSTNEKALYSVKRQDYHTIGSFEQDDHDIVYQFDWAGFFQLYKDKQYYPEFSMDASGCDIVFLHLFIERSFLPLTVKHIGVSATNWKGRVSDPWYLS
jgi:hypothetical protein